MSHSSHPEAPVGLRRPRRLDAGFADRPREYISLIACILAFVAGIAAPTPSGAHEGEVATAIVIDTDLGLDDAVALAMMLQHPALDIAAVVAGEGVADAAVAGDQAARMAAGFNRPDVPVFAAPDDPDFPAPPFRERATTAIDSALIWTTERSPEPLRPQAYVEPGHRMTVLALGPLSRLAAALDSDPGMAAQIDRIVISGDPGDPDDWNLNADRAALARLRAGTIPLTFVRPGDRGHKPGDWYTDHLVGGQGTSLGEAWLDRLLANPAVRRHYLAGLTRFHDELAALYLVEPELFVETSEDVFEPAGARVAAAALAEALGRGRQCKDRVVFIDGPLPATVLRDDVRMRRDDILAANGPDEWFAQLLLNELHEHLGAYSIIGVKMGLRAGELLNAPQHSMSIVSAAPSSQPVSCLNDGLLVSTGSTPGRTLFQHAPGPPGTVQASFSFNGRTVTLRLKDEYRGQIRSAISGLLERYTLEDDDYWDGVRDFGLDIWQHWHRRDLFEADFRDNAGRGERP
ncbi:MAG: nucleoside hydrolase [Thermoanaerobaculales bacterium]|jgi:inosine-uridine nucleoside N-ribohydrolase|nr:nucleoside hydrolase [Thermoanaerobaculales bacterium]